MANQDGDHPVTVPKFASFKSKEPERSLNSKARDKPDDHREKSRRSSDHRSHGRDSRDRHRHERHRDRRERRRSHSRDRGETKDTEVRGSVRPEPSVSKPDNFIIDTKGDPLIRRFGGLDSAQVVPYYRHGAGRILGSAGRLVVHRDQAKDYFSIRMPGEGSHMYQDKDGLRSRNPRLKIEPVRLTAKEGASAEAADSDFIPLSTSRKRKRAAEEAAASSSDEDIPSYRSIEGKAKARKTQSDDDSDSDSDSSNAVMDTWTDDPVTQKSIQLNRQVKDSPGDINAWLQLVQHQDVLLRSGEAVDHRASANEAHSYAEIKVSMLESALENTSSTEDRHRVLVPLMREGMKVWQPKTAEKRWAGIEQEERENFELWDSHLDFHLSDIANFHYDDIKQRFIDRLRLVLSRRDPRGPEAQFREAVYVFLRATCFIRDAGYKELAAAAWQGLLELSFFRPDKFRNTVMTADSLMEFWESEAPRIGDAEAQGWRQYESSGEDDAAAEPKRMTADRPASSRDSYKAWGIAERFHAQAAKIPAKTLDEGTEDDPFRVVMFSDIEPLLFCIPEDVLAILSEQLIDAFLLFCGYPPAFRRNEWTERAFKDQFVRHLSSETWAQRPGESSADDTEEDYSRAPWFGAGGLYATSSTDMMFPGANWFRYLPAKSLEARVDSQWLLNGLKLLVHTGGFAWLARYYMACCSSESPSSVKKVARALLKQSPTDEEVYNAYTWAEFANGNQTVGVNVVTSAIGMKEAFSHWHGILLWQSLAMNELERGEIGAAAKRLCSAVDSDSQITAGQNAQLSAAQILRARQQLTANFHECLGASRLELTPVYAECLGLLSYLTSEGCTEPTSSKQGNISAAMLSLASLSDEYRRRGHEKTASHEQVLHFAARLLYMNAVKGPFRRAYVQEQLRRFLDVFPQNTVFLALFDWADSSLRVIDETRTLLYDKVLTPSHDCISSRAFSIRHEMTRGNANTTKSAFEKALSSDRSRYSASLWIAYIRFCHHEHREREMQQHQQQQTRRSKPTTTTPAGAKDVFYRALRHCPWSKEVMMEAFGTLVGEMESEELRAVYNTMTAKGLRVHVDLDEFLERRRSHRTS